MYTLFIKHIPNNKSKNWISVKQFLSILSCFCIDGINVWVAGTHKNIIVIILQYKVWLFFRWQRFWWNQNGNLKFLVTCWYETSIDRMCAMIMFVPDRQKTWFIPEKVLILGTYSASKHTEENKFSKICNRDYLHFLIIIYFLFY